MSSYTITKLSQQAYKFLVKYIDASLLDSLFQFLSFDLKRGGIFVTASEYGSLAIVTSGITFFITSITLILSFSLIFKSIAGGMLIGIIGGFFLSGIVFLSFLLYPKNKSMENEKKITFSLPFATYYLITIAGSGATIIQMFRTLSKMKGYPQLSKEAKRIVYMTDNMGYNIIDALKIASDRTPSQQFRDLLWGIRNTIIIGGDLIIYLREKATYYLQEYKRFLVKYSQQLALLVEVYTTLVLVGSIFLMVLSLVMGMLVTNIIIPFIQITTIFIGIPIITAIFIVIFKTLGTE